MSTTPLEGTMPVPEVSTDAPVAREPDHFEEIQAPYQFTTDEIDRMNMDLRQTLGAIKELDGQKKAAMQDFKLRIQNKQNESEMLLNKLNAGEETRPVRAEVFFDAKRSMKQYFFPGGDFIREERMQPADWQLPMFRKDPETAAEVPATPAQPGEQVLHTPRGTITRPVPADVGETSLGNVIDAASAKTEAAQFVLDLTKDDWTEKGLTAAFKKAAGLAGWTPVQISTINTILKNAADVDAMIDTLRPYTVGALAKATPADPVTAPEVGNEPETSEASTEEIQETGVETDPVKPAPEPDFLGE